MSVVEVYKHIEECKDEHYTVALNIDTDRH